MLVHSLTPPAMTPSVMESPFGVLSKPVTCHMVPTGQGTFWDASR
jgi:hypothetical protein